jgi:hypothetical protein
MVDFIRTVYLRKRKMNRARKSENRHIVEIFILHRVLPENATKKRRGKKSDPPSLKIRLRVKGRRNIPFHIHSTIK